MIMTNSSIFRTETAEASDLILDAHSHNISSLATVLPTKEILTLEKEEGGVDLIEFDDPALGQPNMPAVSQQQDGVE